MSNVDPYHGMGSLDILKAGLNWPGLALPFRGAEGGTMYHDVHSGPAVNSYIH